MRIPLLSSLLTLFVVAGPQNAELPDPLGASDTPRPELSQALETLQGEHGGSWKVWQDRGDGLAEMIYGGSAAAAFQPLSDADWFEVAMRFIEETGALHHVRPETLRPLSLDFLPLGQIGSNDKWNAKFVQEIDGVPVADAYVNVLMNASGAVLSLQTGAAPDFSGASTISLQTEDSARAIALRLFAARSTAGAGFASAPRLLFLRTARDKFAAPLLAWQVDVYPAAGGVEPEAWRFWIEDASGDLLADRDLIQNFDVGGQVASMATPGTAPDSSSNPEIQLPLPNVRVTSSAGTVYTDANGNFNFPGVNGPLNVTVDYVGTYNDVRNSAGSDYTLTVPAQTGQGNTILLNPSSQDLVTSQANCYLGVTDCRNWINAVIPTDTTPDFQAVSNANLNDTCNAYYNGVSINMFQAGGGCVNTGYSTVVVHEYGHWMNDRYSTGNGNDGMGEGNADVFAMYLYDDPIVGLDFCGNGCNIRDGNNNRQYCGDGNSACYGEVHADGEPWMGAAWKVRQRLKTTHGVSAGGLTADTLFLSWMNAYNQQTIDSIIEVQWLTLDDDDGNIDNGTPNYTDIDQGFLAQGFPGYSLALISITNVTQLPDTASGAGPFVVDADVIALVNPPLISVELFQRVNGGAWTSSFMASTGGNGFTGSIPSQVAPAVVDYYVRATDNNLVSTTSPIDAPTGFYSFTIGTLNVLFFDDFEGGDNGWTHASFGDTSNSQDDWQHGAVFGQAGDPGSAFSGSQVWGNDLGGSGFNGEYQNNVHNYLRSPNIDCSSSIGTTLRFKRWLRVEKSQWDQARVSVNGTEVWVNDFGLDNLDSSWTSQEIDISALADGNPAVQIEFSLQTDTSVTFGGWTIDDVEVLFLGGGGFLDCNGNGVDDALDISSGTSLDCNANGVPDECELAGNDCNANGIPDECDIDCNSNGTPDDCETLADCNGNGTPDVCESFTDCNTNGIPDECELAGNDCNANGIPDECDPDCNANGTPDDCETITDCNTNGIPDECELVGNDCNANGIPDECDPDCNANGTPDDCETLEDCNTNGIPDVCESLVDCNANGTPDVCESFTDCNTNGVPDECELVGNDCNANGIPDECDLDCNSNGTPDDCENLTDCDTNGVPDVCELAGNDCNANGILDACEPDCNANGIPDDCESLADCNANGTPDVCESITDCNANGIPDECELAGNDCNANGIPDECDTDCDGNGTPDDCESFADCNGNGVPDSCDIAQGTSLDSDGNGVPDECIPGTAFCFGDGSGAPCPCGNSGAAGEGCANSTGAGAVLAGGGSDSAAADDLALDGSQLPANSMVLLFSGTGQVNGGNGLTFGDGLRCAGGNILRHGVKVASSGGQVSWGPGLATANGWANGDLVHFQAWYRDPIVGPCGTGFNLTNGLAVSYTP